MFVSSNSGYNKKQFIGPCEVLLHFLVLHRCNQVLIFNFQVKSQCNLPAPKPGSQSVALEKAASQLQSQLKSRNKRALNADLYDQMIQVKEQLLISMNMYDTLSEDICDQEIVYDQDPDSLKCWNGTAVGK